MWSVLEPQIVAHLPSHGINGKVQAGVAPIQRDQGESSSWQERVAELERIKRYEKDWDGQGAPAPSSEVVQSAIQLAAALRDATIDAPSCVVAGVNGTVIFEWQKTGGAYLEIEVTEPYRADACLIVPGKPTEHWTLR